MSHSTGPVGLRSSVAVLLLGFAAGCAGDSSHGGFDEVPLWTSVQELRVGSLNDPRYSFGPVQAMVVAPNGDMLSLHSPEGVIRRWSADGKPLGMLGRPGEGPGEYRRPMTMGWVADTLWVLDSDGYRISYFSAAGEYFDRITPRVDIGRPDGGGLPARPSGYLADGSILGSTFAASRSVIDGTLTRVATVRMSREGVELDSIATLPVGRSAVLGVMLPGGMQAYSSQPFTDSAIGRSTDDGTGFLVLERPATTSNAEVAFGLIRLDLEGDTVFSRSFRYMPVPLPGEVVDSAVTSIAERFHGFGERSGTTPAALESEVREAMYIPSHYPPVGQLLAGRDGSIWLALAPAVDGIVEWLVLDSDAEPVGRLRLPESTQVLEAEIGKIWTSELDELEVPYIVRYAVREE